MCAIPQTFAPQFCKHVRRKCAASLPQLQNKREKCALLGFHSSLRSLETRLKADYILLITIIIYTSWLLVLTFCLELLSKDEYNTIELIELQ